MYILTYMRMNTFEFLNEQPSKLLRRAGAARNWEGKCETREIKSAGLASYLFTLYLYLSEKRSVNDCKDKMGVFPLSNLPSVQYLLTLKEGLSYGRQTQPYQQLEHCLHLFISCRYIQNIKRWAERIPTNPTIRHFPCKLLLVRVGLVPLPRRGRALPYPALALALS